MKQYKDYAFHNLTKKSISSFRVENTANCISAFSNDTTTIENGYLEMQFNILANGIKLIGASYIMGNRINEAERKISEKNSELFTNSNAAVEQAKCNKRKLVTVISGMAGVAGITAQLEHFFLVHFLLWLVGASLWAS